MAVLLLIVAIVMLNYSPNSCSGPTTQTASPFQPQTQSLPPPGPPPPMPLGPPALKGSVQDVTGAIVPGATVTVSLSDGSGHTMQTTSNENGRYSFNPLPTQTVKVSVEKAGFRKMTYSRVVLKNGLVKRLNFTLGIGQSTEEVVINVRQ